MKKIIAQKILKLLYYLYDESPTAVLPTFEIANLLKISIKEAQGGCIYLKEKNWINSYPRSDDWYQKISALGIDELEKSTSKPLEKITHFSHSLEMDVINDDFESIMDVFISHKFENRDQKFALKLQEMLREKQIRGYLAERKRNYELLISDKIKNEITNSDFIIGIITNASKTSASVNQELGFAMGNEKPVIMLLEKGIEHGVLTFGKEVEEFTEKNFEKACTNIINYILDKNYRKEVPTKENEWMLTNVYRPLYNEISELKHDKIFIDKQISNPISKIDSFSKLKLDEKLRNDLEKLSDEIVVWNKMFRAKEREFQYKQNEIGEIFATCFQTNNLLNSRGEIELDSHTWQEPRNWTKAFQDVLLEDPEIVSGKQLYEKLYAHAILRDDEHDRFLKNFKKRSPALFDCLFNHIPEARKVYAAEIKDKELAEQKMNIKTNVQKILKNLEAILDEK